MTRHRIPVRVGPKSVSTRIVDLEKTEAAEQAQKESSQHAQKGSFQQAQRGSSDSRSQPTADAPRGSSDPRSDPATRVSAPAYGESKECDEGQTDCRSQSAWRDRALRLQAEMDNYRKRQRRIAQEQAQADQERLLHDVIRVADNLDRTLAAGQQGGAASGASQTPSPLGRSSLGTSSGLRQGVELTRDELLRVLAKYGLERFEALGEPFDPEWHEAVHVVPARTLGVEPGTVVEQVQPGYRKRDLAREAAHGARLFRPAQVVVAN